MVTGAAGSPRIGKCAGIGAGDAVPAAMVSCGASFGGIERKAYAA